MNELKNVAIEIATNKYTLGEDKLLFTIYHKEIVNNEVETLLSMGWETNRTSAQQPIEVINYINNNR